MRIGTKWNDETKGPENESKADAECVASVLFAVKALLLVQIMSEWWQGLGLRIAILGQWKKQIS